jgi:hypothetical protein
VLCKRATQGVGDKGGLHKLDQQRDKMMAEKSETKSTSKRNSKNTSSDKLLRIYNPKVLSDIDRILELHNPNYNSTTAILNRAIEFGLPKILAEIDPATSIENIMSNQTDRIIAHLNRLYSKIERKQNRILASVAMNSELTSTVMQELEMLMIKNGIDITDEARSSLMLNLLPPFSEEYDVLLSQIEGEVIDTTQTRQFNDIDEDEDEEVG